MNLNIFQRLSGNRVLGYAEYGDPAGVPIFHFHGFPACRLEVKFLDNAAQMLGIRLISPDRPGIGISPFCKYDSMLDWPEDLIQLADALKLDTFNHAYPVDSQKDFCYPITYSQRPDVLHK